MREIKFRVWDKHEKKMGKVTGIKFSDVQHTLVHYRYVDDRGRVIDEQSHVDDKGHGVVVLVQYTGLKDKNGKEIYEGDIVKYTRYIYTDCSRKEVEYKEEPVIGEIYYAEGIWLGIRFKDETGWIFNPGTVSTSKNNKELEVIGNIYENPELLEC